MFFTFLFRFYNSPNNIALLILPERVSFLLDRQHITEEEQKWLQVELFAVFNTSSNKVTISCKFAGTELFTDCSLLKEILNCKIETLQVKLRLVRKR